MRSVSDVKRDGLITEIKAVAERLGMRVYVNEPPRTLHSIQVFNSTIVVYFYYFTQSMYPHLRALINLLKRYKTYKCEIVINSDITSTRVLNLLLRLGFTPDFTGDLVLSL